MPDYDQMFDERGAAKELRGYRQRGPQGSTRRLIDALRAEGVEEASLLDIGGGIGVIQHELLGAGVSRAMNVDASRPYLAAARSEAERRGLGDRVEYLHADFVAAAGSVAPADIVTLDRAICCYGNMPALVGRSVERAHRLYGFVVPVDRWWNRLAVVIGNLVLRLAGRGFRGHVHSTQAMHELVRDAGFERRYLHRGWLWETAVYRRAGEG